MTKVYLIQQNLIKKMGLGLEKIGIDKINKGDRVVIKAHMGEYGNLNYVRPPIIGKIVEIIKSFGGKPFLFDTTTMYRGSRFTVEDYLETARKNGFTQETIGCPVVVSDDGILIKTNGLLGEVEVAKELHDADAIVVVSHVKGHEMSGFGGAIKNLGMGGVTRQGKTDVHRKNFPDSLTEAAYATLKDFDEDEKFFVNVLLDIAPKCDCMPLGSVDPGFPICGNIGILFSTDIVAIDNASVDLVNKEAGENIFFKLHKIDPKKHVKYAEKLGMGKLEYELIKIG